MYEEEEEEEKERKKERVKQENQKLIINVNNELPKSGSLVFSYSIPADMALVHSDFLKIATRDYGRNGKSQLLQKLIRGHVEAHKAGNENAQITSYVPIEDAPSPHHLLCNYVRGVRRDGQIFCTFPKHDSVVVAGVSGVWVNGVACFACNRNKLRKAKA